MTAHLRNFGKVVPIYSCPHLRERYPVYIFDIYLDKLPSEAREKRYSTFVRYQKSNLTLVCTSTSRKRHASNKANSICKQAGVSGNKTNYSLRATVTHIQWHNDKKHRHILQYWTIIIAQQLNSWSSLYGYTEMPYWQTNTQASCLCDVGYSLTLAQPILTFGNVIPTCVLLIYYE